VNLVAVLALVLGVAPNVPGFLHRFHVIGGARASFAAIYPYAWMTGFFGRRARYSSGRSCASGIPKPVSPEPNTP